MIAMIGLSGEEGKCKDSNNNNNNNNAVDRRIEGLRRGSAAARLMILWVRIPLGLWMCVCCECYQVEVSASCRSLLQRSLTGCSVSECDRESSIMRMSLPTGSCCARVKKY